MLGKNLYVYLSIIFSGIVATVFALNLGLIVNVSAQDSPDYLLGNMTFSTNLTAAQIEEISEKIANYTKTMKEKAKGNLTEMNMLLFDDMEKRNIINEKEKQDLRSVFLEVNKIKPAGNLTILDREVSSVVDRVGGNSTNPTVISLLNTLKRIPHDIGTDVGTLGAPVTIDNAFESIGKGTLVTVCAAAGGILGGGMGAFVAGTACTVAAM